jgi:hypothetical protein
MRIYFFLFLSFALHLTSCVNNERDKSQEPQKKDSLQKVKKLDSSHTVIDKQFDLANELTSHFANQVKLDSLLDKITHQEKVKVVAELNEEWDDENQWYKYSDSIYQFKLKIFWNNSSRLNTVLFDGSRRISFNDYAPLCLTDKKFHCENYGFNAQNSLEKPKVIEVCGKRFLYANISFQCNGVGCGCNITFIYDLETHRPVFLENFRVSYEGFLLSDFDDDNIPDLLVFGQTEMSRMKGYDLDEFEIKLVPYTYEKGRFKEKWDYRYQQPYCYELYGVIPYYYQCGRIHRIYAITKDNWLRH